jgi:hypothetical protein
LIALLIAAPVPIPNKGTNVTNVSHVINPAKNAK